MLHELALAEGRQFCLRFGETHFVPFAFLPVGTGDFLASNPFSVRRK
jgi:hypothetical protein